MYLLIVIMSVAAMLLWLFSIRSYCHRHGKGFTTGAAAGVTFWVDWQEAGEIAKIKNDRGMIMVCRIVFGLKYQSSASPSLPYSINSLRPGLGSPYRSKTMTPFNTSREIPATMEQVFAAISNPERLARWWGPAGRIYQHIPYL